MKHYWQCTPYNCNASVWGMTYTYDVGGDVSNWTHPGGFTLSNTINAAQQITQMTRSNYGPTQPQYLLQNASYTPWGTLETLTNGCYGTGQNQNCTEVIETRVYNNRLQPITSLVGNSTNWGAYGCLFYNWYASGGTMPTQCNGNPTSGSQDNGNVIGYKDFDGSYSSLSHTAAYSYDALNRLSTAAATGSSTYNFTFGYDRYGNATCTQGPSSACPSFSFNSKNQITNSGFSYGPAGNLSSDGVFNYVNDGEGRLSTVSSGATRTYTYNAFGQIADDTGNSKLYDPFGNWLGAVQDTSGLFYAQEVPFGNRPLSLYSTSANDTYFIHPNLLGTSTQTTNHAGTVTGDVLFYPWGQPWTTTGSYEEHFATFYPGYDNTVGVSPAWARQYKNTQMRWLGPDPADSGAVDLRAGGWRRARALRF